VAFFIEAYMTKEEVIASIRKCAEEVGRAPTRDQLQRAGIGPAVVRKLFGAHLEALRQAGLEAVGPGYVATVESLLTDWATVTRQLGRLATRAEYNRDGRFSSTTLEDRWGAWSAVPGTFRDFVRKRADSASWQDVLQIIEENSHRAKPRRRPYTRRRQPQIPSVPAPLRGLYAGRPVYGPQIIFPGLAHEPVDEMGVVYVFGMVAHRLGFAVLRTQPNFPDCEALREVQPGKWQRVRIEFEYESRNFAKHRHNKDGCDLIVCWRHNWAECPSNLEVIELRSILFKL
jgi:Homing endonuclease associated repeat